MIGRVVSTKMNHTATVLVERTARHPLYRKTFIRSKKYLVDDLVGVKDGDVVEIKKIRPVSKNKHWQVVKVVGQNLAEIVEARQKEAAKELIAEVMPESPEKSEELRKSENQKIGKSDNPEIRPSDTPSSSESSEKNKRKNNKRSK